MDELYAGEEEAAAVGDLEEFKKSLIRIRPVREACLHVTRFLSGLLGTRRIGIYLWDETEGAFTAFPADPADPADPEENDRARRIRIYDRFFLFLSDYDRTAPRSLFESGDPKFADIADDALAFFRDLKADLLIPLVINFSMVGLIFAEREEPPGPELLAALEETRAMSVMALSNSILYERHEALLRRLEEKVAERTSELEEAQNQLVQSEKMAMLGVMTAGIAHEINTPSSVIQGGSENLKKNLEFILDGIDRLRCIPSDESRDDFEFVRKRVMKIVFAGRRKVVRDSFKRKKALREILERRSFPLARRLGEFLTENGLFAPDDRFRLEEAAERFLNSPFMVRLERLFQSLAEEDRKFMEEYLEALAACSRNMRNIRFSNNSVARIIKALKHYSRADQGEAVLADLHDGLENTVIMLAGVMKRKIKVDYEYGRNVPPILCHADELNQVWTNIILNAYHALDNVPRPVIAIRTARTELRGRPAAEVRIKDNGPGIPQEIQSRIWDPFFTTKDQGEGSGLGLGIVKGIVERHGGEIDLISESGEGAEFRAVFPAAPGREGGAA